MLMLKARYEETKTCLGSPPVSLEHLHEAVKLLDEYREVLRKFMRRIYTVSLMVNAAVTITVIILILER